MRNGVCYLTTMTKVATLPQQSWKTTAFMFGGLIGLPSGVLTVEWRVPTLARMLGARKLQFG